MATISVYKQCIERCKKLGIRDFYTGSYKPNLKRLFGDKKLVNKCKFNRCSKAEQRRHLQEDRILRILYIEHDSHV